jgi:hypothetical protein
MNRKVLSLFSFGLVLITIGGIGTFFAWDKAMVFIGLGLTLESLALLLFAWKRIKN